MNKTPENNNVTWFNGHVSRKDREKLHGHKGALIWFTGLSASGKSTIAHLAEKELHRRGCSTYVFDGDNVRHGLCADLRFGPEDRTENIRRIGEMVKLFVDAGMIVLTAFISPYRKDRRKVRSLLKDGQYL
ncbi:MAG: adenylyl-sulfate kinase, partial [Desulfobacteria bacterium]